jgi:hypothetical protein
MRIRNDKYVLNAQGEPVVARDTMEWGCFYGMSELRRVDRTILPDGRVVSTIFLGLDHNYEDDGPPILWETMVFPKDGDYSEVEMDRCAGSREQAQAMHQRMVEKVSHEPVR